MTNVVDSTTAAGRFIFYMLSSPDAKKKSTYAEVFSLFSQTGLINAEQSQKDHNNQNSDDYADKMISGSIATPWTKIITTATTEQNQKNYDKNNCR
jgi:hypothetical protein